MKPLVCFSVIVTAFVLVVGCSNDNNTPSGNSGTVQAPSFSIDSVTVPDAMMQSSDPMAQMAVSYVMMANAFSAYWTWFAPPTSSNGPPWTYTWTDSNLTVTLTIKEQGNNWVWDIVFDGTGGGYTYNNWLFIHAEQAQDNSSGQLLIYEPVTDSVAWIWSWDVDSQGVYHLVMISKSDQSKVEVTVNPDESGHLKAYEEVAQNYQLIFEANWLADGSGQWWQYDQNGQLIGSGSWS